MDKQQLLDQVAKDIIATKGGPMATFGTNPVPGEGSCEAEILFIGEAPGATEDQMRRPYVGVSGQLLRKQIVEAGFKIEDVYITNIVKFRPPENRDPLPAEIEFFKPFLDRQIEIIEPKVIVTVGRFSMYKFLDEGVSISKIHGVPRLVSWNGKRIYVFPMFHPAAALRAGEMMKMFTEDFKKLREFIEKLDSNGSQADVTDEKVEAKSPLAKQMELI